jgi:hypothetical protein
MYAGHTFINQKMKRAPRVVLVHPQYLSGLWRTDWAGLHDL